MKMRFFLRRSVPGMFLLVIIAITLFSFLKPAGSGNPDALTGPTKPQIPMVQIGMVAVDYTTGKIMGHKFFNFQRNYPDTCKKIPLIFQQQMSGDFGSFSIKLIGRYDTLAAGSIVWNGTGSLRIPAFLDTMTYTEYENAYLQKALNTKYMNSELSATDKSKADKLHQKLRKLQVLQGIMAYPYKAGFYLCTPAVGKTNYTKAMWLCFFSSEY